VRFLYVLAFVAIASTAIGDDRGAEEAAEAERICAAELPRWKLTVDGIALDRPKESVLRWTNPFAGRVYGNTYVWLHEGRPAAASCLFRYFDPYRSFNGELVALTGNKLVANRDEKLVWEPKHEWKWHLVHGAPTPASTAAQRLVQMRALAAEFAVEVLDTRNVAKGEDQTPRLLPKLLLLLECDTTAAKPVWKFGVGRMNRYQIRLKRKGETVWEVAAIKDSSREDEYLFIDIGLPRGESKP
jgi:hypothetical protein